MMFFSAVPGLNFDMCMISTRIKTIYPSDILGIVWKFLSKEKTLVEYIKSCREGLLGDVSWQPDCHYNTTSLITGIWLILFKYH